MVRVTVAPRLRALAALAVLASAMTPASAQSLSRWEAPIAEASARFGIPATWIERVIRAESAGHTARGGRPIRSRAGAMGLMQLMPGTWQAMRSAHGLGSDPDDPRDNILAGTAYLRAMYDRFGYPGLFAAYNAGPARYSEHLVRGRRLPSETVAYVAKLVSGERRRAGPRSMRSAAASPDRLLYRRPGREGDRPEGEAQERDGPGVFFRLGGSQQPQTPN
jgi:soluble lytic murein transglycosylase-like protein